MTESNYILTINGGSSSIKFSLYKTGDTLTQVMKGQLESIGSKNAKFHFTDTITHQQSDADVTVADQNEAADYLIDWLEKQDKAACLKAIGHRVVHGMQHTKPEKITPGLIEELKKISAYDPEHLPGEIKLIEVFARRYPSLVQVACFDTSFHTTMPVVAKLLPIPRKYYNKGVQRYGFHGLSYAFLMQELARIGDKEAKGKIILAHLGNGASIAAVKDGKSVDTSMAFTPASGITMSTRTGDLDPGVAWYLMDTEQIAAKDFSKLINHQSGLLGVSETNSDMRELMKLESSDHRAAEAIELFCYTVKKWIGAYAAALGGIDTLVFAGGIGENDAVVRKRICNGLEFLGIEINEITNTANQAVISAGKVVIRVIKTNEELMIATLVNEVISNTGSAGA